jgi:mannose-6-phosphate isomerase
LRDLMQERGSEILGRTRPARDGSFPLLVKFLDAAEALSVQVHPSVTMRGLPEGDAPKTECWYVLAARPGSVVYLGPRHGCDQAVFEALSVDRRVLNVLEAHPVEAGSFVFVPGGTVHAIGMGVTLVEIQETSDTTYRIWDWDRAGNRPLHREQAARAIRFDRALEAPFRARAVPMLRGFGPERVEGVARARLVDCPEFSVELLEIDGNTESHLGLPESHLSRLSLVYVALAGRGRLHADIGPLAGKSWDLAPGDTWLVPASFGRHHIESTAPLRCLRVVTKS